VVAAINVSAQAARTEVEDVHDRLLPPLLATAQAIERDLTAARPPAG
jgi:IclR family transcriptional regulator, pca regulon regulatory protein